MSDITNSAAPVESCTIVLRDLDQLCNDMADLTRQGWRIDGADPVITRQDGLSEFRFVRDVTVEASQ